MPIPTNNHQTVETSVFGSAYLGNVRYYAALLSAKGDTIIDTGERINKHSWMHNHCRIVGANGIQTLAIPVEHATLGTGERILMRDLRISEHGDWRRVHRGAIFSAYGKTPFFEYIEDDLNAIYERHDKWLIDFNMALHNLAVEFIDLPIHVQTAEVTDISHILDYRGVIGGKKPDGNTAITDIEYYNIWQGRHGFIPALSILDLLMNCGRESIFILNKMLNKVLN